MTPLSGDTFINAAILGQFVVLFVIGPAIAEGMKSASTPWQLSTLALILPAWLWVPWLCWLALNVSSITAPHLPPGAVTTQLGKKP